MKQNVTHVKMGFQNSSRPKRNSRNMLQVKFYQTARRNIIQDSHLHNRCCENLEYNMQNYLKNHAKQDSARPNTQWAFMLQISSFKWDLRWSKSVLVYAFKRLKKSHYYGWVVSVTPRGKDPRYLLYKGSVGPRRLYTDATGKNPFVSAGDRTSIARSSSP
jgi:hypothetical protein